MSGSHLDTPARLRQLLGLTRDEPAIRMDKLAEARGFPTAEAARKYVTRHREQIASRKVAGHLVVTLREFDLGCDRIEAARRKSA